MEVSIINLCGSFKAIATFSFHMIIRTRQLKKGKVRINKMALMSRVNEYIFATCPDIWKRRQGRKLCQSIRNAAYKVVVSSIQISD